MSLLKKLSDAVQGKAPFDCNRSPKWQKIRNNHLKVYNKCEACGSLTQLEVHHIKPFHIHPELELDQNNLITLCENSSKGVTCHLFFGHLGDYKKDNQSVETDVVYWKGKLI